MSYMLTYLLQGGSYILAAHMVVRPATFHLLRNVAITRKTELVSNPFPILTSRFSLVSYVKTNMTASVRAVVLWSNSKSYHFVINGYLVQIIEGS